MSSENTESKKSEKIPEMNHSSLLKAYKDYVLELQHASISKAQFCKGLGINESEFNKYYSSLTAIEESCWRGYMDEVINTLTTQDEYDEFTVREKLLSFFYGLIEVMKQDRKFISIIWKKGLIPGIPPFSLGPFKDAFIIYAKELIREGCETGEIEERMFISDYYEDGLWLEVLFVLDFWVKDNSGDFENTDAAIEKSVQMSMDLLGRTGLDSVVDFAKFLIQN